MLIPLTNKVKGNNVIILVEGNKFFIDNKKSAQTCNKFSVSSVENLGMSSFTSSDLNPNYIDDMLLQYEIQTSTIYSYYSSKLNFHF